MRRTIWFVRRKAESEEWRVIPSRHVSWETVHGSYEVTALIGSGGMGEVYKATDTGLDRTVAIKVLLAHVADDSDLRQRFEREAKTISSLNHPYICTLYDIGRAPRSGVGRGGPTSEAASRGAGVPASDEAGIDFLVRVNVASVAGAYGVY